MTKSVANTYNAMNTYDPELILTLPRHELNAGSAIVFVVIVLFIRPSVLVNVKLSNPSTYLCVTGNGLHSNRCG